MRGHRGDIAMLGLTVLVARQHATGGQEAEQEEEEEDEAREIATRADARHNQSPSTSLVRRLDASRRLI